MLKYLISPIGCVIHASRLKGFPLGSGDQARQGTLPSSLLTPHMAALSPTLREVRQEWRDGDTQEFSKYTGLCHPPCSATFLYIGLRSHVQTLIYPQPKEFVNLDMIPHFGSWGPDQYHRDRAGGDISLLINLSQWVDLPHHLSLIRIIEQIQLSPHFKRSETARLPTSSLFVKNWVSNEHPKRNRVFD